MTNAPFETLKQQCRTLADQKRYTDALRVAKQMLEQDAEDIGVHKLLALLYGLNNQHREAHQHYMMLVQFDGTYTLENCLLVADGYAEEGLHKAAGLLCIGAYHRLKVKELKRLAGDYFDAAGEKELAAKVRVKI